jgi:hypothetical protein
MQDDTHLRHDPERTAAYIDGTLEAASRAAVTAHLARCRDCREVLALIARGMDDTAAHAAGRGFQRWLPLAASLVIAAGAGAYVLVRSPSTGPAAPPTAPPAVSSSPGTVPPVAPVPPPPSEKRPSPQSSPDVTRSVGARRVAGHRFHLVAGEWIDDAYDPMAALPVVVVSTATQQRETAARTPALRRYAALGPRFTVVLAGTVYRVDVR